MRGLVSAQIHRILDDIRAGEFGSWPIIIALIIISAFFYSKDSLLLSGSNLITVIEQVAPLATLAIGVTFVLLIAEIDLSVAYLSALTGSVVVAELSTRHAHLSGLIVIPTAIAAGALFGDGSGHVGGVLARSVVRRNSGGAAGGGRHCPQSRSVRSPSISTTNGSSTSSCTRSREA